MTVCSNLLLESYCLLPHATLLLLLCLSTSPILIIKCCSREPIINVQKMTSVLIKEYIDKQSTIYLFFFLCLDVHGMFCDEDLRKQETPVSLSKNNNNKSIIFVCTY